MKPFVAFSLIGGILLSGNCGHAAELPLPAAIEFNRDIRPVMSDTCFHCHGFDHKSREAGMRLDVREDALKKTKEGVLPIVPGKPEASAIIARIMDADDPMPPEKAHKPLTARQKELFRQWVAEGAVYEPHWSYAPIKKRPVPAGGQPIDSFVLARLGEDGLQSSAEAPRAILLRRLSLDLTGLPPTPAEQQAWLADRSADAWERQVERLLQSPRFGERMAVWWLDIARFADTVGFHGDQNQRIFPYRDYVINAFNGNKPFDQFTVEQLAGDLLPEPTQEQLVATGYNRLNMMTREGGAQPKEYLAKYGAERVRSVAAAWFGSTFGCAECHDHKFDPIKTRDFYELQSFFADVKQWGVYANYGYTPEPELRGVNNDSPFPPEIEVESPYLRKRFDAIVHERDKALKDWLKSAMAEPAQRDAFSRWESDAKAYLGANAGGWRAPVATARILVKGKEAATPQATVNAAGVVSVAKKLGKDEVLEILLPTDGLAGIAACRIELLTDTVSADKLPGLLGRTLEVSVQLERVATGKRSSVGLYAGDATARQIMYSGGIGDVGVGNRWVLPFEKPEGPLLAVWLLAEPVLPAPGDRLIFTFKGDNELPLQISLSPFADHEPLDAAAADVVTALAGGGTQNPDQAERRGAVWLLSTAADRAVLEQCRKLTASARALHGGHTWTMVTKAAATPLTVRVLPRGNWQDESGPIVLPATPSFLPGRIESTEQHRLTRLDLARYLTGPENPITARAVMNRLWQQFFGIGLSAAVDDLGSQGELPSNPELLDYLASEFRDSGWDVKHMIRLIVASRTYRQSSTLRPELKDRDPGNRLLASQNPRRLDAEFIRDNALFVAGILNLDDIGGPSVFPYQPEGYYAALQFPNRTYVASTGKEQYRRGVYSHWQRTFLQPMLANFDAPARDECAALRVSSNTPQQALTLLNDPTFVEAARLFAQRLVLPGGETDGIRLAHGFELALNRAPSSAETGALLAFLARQRAYYRDNSAEAGKLMQVGMAPPAPALDPIELAAWTQVCRALLNAHETITRY